MRLLHREDMATAALIAIIVAALMLVGRTG